MMRGFVYWLFFMEDSITLYEKKHYVFNINVLFYKVLNKYFTIVKVS